MKPPRSNPFFPSEGQTTLSPATTPFELLPEVGWAGDPRYFFFPASFSLQNASRQAGGRASRLLASSPGEKPRASAPLPIAQGCPPCTPKDPLRILGHSPPKASPQPLPHQSFLAWRRKTRWGTGRATPAPSRASSPFPPEHPAPHLSCFSRAELNCSQLAPAPRLYMGDACACASVAPGSSLQSAPAVPGLRILPPALSSVRFTPHPGPGVPPRGKAAPSTPATRAPLSLGLLSPLEVEERKT